MNEREGKFNTKGFLYRNGNSEVDNGCGKDGTLDTTTNNIGWWVALGPQTTTQKLQIVPLQQRMVSVLLTTVY
jgi:hypothetical protein